jgi:hypothetical protein
MPIDENLEDELSLWLQEIETEGLELEDEEGGRALSSETEEALIGMLERIPLAECVDTIISVRPQLDEIDVSLEALALTNEWMSSTDTSKLRIDPALESLGSHYHGLAEKLLESSALLNLTQDVTGARILLRSALEGGIQGTFLSLAVRPKTQAILLGRSFNFDPDVRSFLRTLRPFKGPESQHPTLDDLLTAAWKLQLKFKQVVAALDQLRVLSPIPDSRNRILSYWSALSAESHVNALQSLFSATPDADEIELKGELKDFRHSYPHLLSEIVDVIVVSRINYLDSYTGSRVEPPSFLLTPEELPSYIHLPAGSFVGSLNSLSWGTFGKGLIRGNVAGEGQARSRDDIDTTLVRLAKVPKIEKALDDRDIEPLAHLASTTPRSFELVYSEKKTDLLLSAHTVDDLRTYVDILDSVYGELKCEKFDSSPSFLGQLPTLVGLKG